MFISFQVILINNQPGWGGGATVLGQGLRMLRVAVYFCPPLSALSSWEGMLDWIFPILCYWFPLKSFPLRYSKAWTIPKCFGYLASVSHKAGNPGEFQWEIKQTNKQTKPTLNAGSSLPHCHQKVKIVNLGNASIPDMRFGKDVWTVVWGYGLSGLGITKGRRSW